MPRLGYAGRKRCANLDIFVRYTINVNFTVFADTSNLTDAVYVACGGSMERPSEVDQIGAHHMLGIRFNY